MMRRKHRIIVASIIGAIISFIGINLLSPVARNAHLYSVKKEDCIQLKEYALDIAETLNPNIIEDDTIKEPEMWLDKKFLYIQVQNEQYQVLAKYPVEMESGSKKGNFNVIVNYDKVSYDETKNHNKAYFIFLSSILSLIIGLGIYVTLYIIPKCQYKNQYID